MSGLQLHYSNGRLLELEVVVQSALDGMAEVLANDMAVLQARKKEMQEARERRKWYQFWNNWWGWDMVVFEMSDVEGYSRCWNRDANRDLISLHNKLTKIRPTEVVLTEYLSNLIIRYAKA